jgi:uncharacterized protein (DUF1810 family)
MKYSCYRRLDDAWMWFVFPQIDGLGHSSNAKHYAIKSIEEAQQYLIHPVLGARLLECSEAIFNIEGKSVSEILGYPDDQKFKSAMTLFKQVAEPGSILVTMGKLMKPSEF